MSGSRHRLLVDIGAGFAIHTGWAAAVLVGGDAPEARRRRPAARHALSEALPRQVYHAVQDMPPAKAALLVREVHEAVDGLTDEVIAELADIARAHGPLVAVGVTGFPVTCPPSTRCSESHALLHLAEGELYRGVCDAADARGLTVVLIHPKEGDPRDCAGCGVPAEPFARRLVDLRAELGAPWQADHRLATAAARLAALARRRLSSAGSSELELEGEDVLEHLGLRGWMART